MKIGNIKNLLSKMVNKYREAIIPDNGREISECLENRIIDLPMKHLEEYFQKRFNKNVDYDQWVGIRDELKSMGKSLYAKTLTIMGDAIFIIQSENQEKIDELERADKENKEEISKLKAELKKYID